MTSAIGFNDSSCCQWLEITRSLGETFEAVCCEIANLKLLSCGKFLAQITLAGCTNSDCHLTVK